MPTYLVGEQHHADLERLRVAEAELIPMSEWLQQDLVVMNCRASVSFMVSSSLSDQRGSEFVLVISPSSVTAMQPARGKITADDASPSQSKRGCA